MPAPDPGSVRLAELLASLSLATDLGMGQPMTHGLRTTLLAMAIARELGADSGTCAATYYTSLLRFVGCTADSLETSRLGGDDIAFREGVARFTMGAPEDLTGWARMRLEPARRASLPRQAREALTAHCEVARLMAAGLGLGDPTLNALDHAFERWDGAGPRGVAGDGIPLASRIAVVARDAELFARAPDQDTMRARLEARAGAAYDPRVAACAARLAPHMLADLDDGSSRDTVVAAEPAPRRALSGGDLDRALTVFADFADAKSPWMHGHSTGVARLAAGAARVAGRSPEEQRTLLRAGLVHDLGRTGVPNTIWDRPAPLRPLDWERVRLHPYLTERVLVQGGALAPLADLAAAHHERLDGSGYHRRLGAAGLSMAARLLAAADACEAMRQARPYRAAIPPTKSAQRLRVEVRDGRLDAAAVEAVLAARDDARPVRPVRPGGLTPREIDVLRHLAAGRQNRLIARRLGITVKTVDHHVQHIYARLGVSTRAAAAVFALQHGLLDD